MTTYTHRSLVRIIMEAETPLAVGSGERDVLTNQLVAIDCNGLPYIPGTALTGVLRHALEKDLGEKIVQRLMGFQGEKKENGNDEGLGSRLILSHAQMVGKDGLPVDCLVGINWNDDFYKPFQNLPLRQHVRISHRGTGEDKGKFDEQVVYKGTRFCFELELVSDGNREDNEAWDKMLELFQSSLFRIGSGTRKGFGELLVQECKVAFINLLQPEQLDLYLNKTSDLNDFFWNGYIDSKKEPAQSPDWVKYELRLKPDNFFLFSSGLESTDAKMIPVTEKVIDWDDSGAPKFTKAQILVPATSVKGALAHRVAFHYNRLTGNTAEVIERQAKEECITFAEKAKGITGENNPAVRALFGYSAKGDDGQCGKVVLSDLFNGEVDSAKKKILNHVSIDRFTGGAMESALFNEEVVYGKETTYDLIIKVVKSTLCGDIEKAFEKALADLATGMLPLGGGTMRGHGCFTGTILKDGKELKNESQN